MYHRSGPGWNPPEPGPGEPWRGSEHTEGWPEELAGPEYWAYRIRDEEWSARSLSWSENAPRPVANPYP